MPVRRLLLKFLDRTEPCTLPVLNPLDKAASLKHRACRRLRRSKLAQSTLIRKCRSKSWQGRHPIPPTPLPPDQLNFRRPASTVTLPLPHGTTESCTTSPLLSLPVELRILIWKYAMGGNVFHIIRRSSRQSPHREVMRHIRCDLFKRHYTRPFPSRGPHNQCLCLEGVYWNETTGLPLLLTSRQIYIESLTYLYTNNTFDFRDAADFCDFTSSLLPTRRRMLRSISIVWPLRMVYYFDHGYLDCYREINSLPSPLEAVRVLTEECEQVRLKVVLQLQDQPGYYTYRGLRARSYWLEPLSRIKGMKEVEVVLRAHGKQVTVEEVKGMRDEIAEVVRRGEGIPEGRWRFVGAGLGWDVPGVFEAR